MRFLQKAGRAFDKLVNFLLLLSAILILLDTLAIAQDVIIRKTVDFTWAPLYELLTYTMVWLTFLGTAAIYRDHGHVRMESILGMLSKRAQNLLNFATSCVVVALCLLCLFLTARLTINDYLNHFILATVLNPVKWPIEMIIPISFLVLTIQAVRHAVNYFKAYRQTSPPTPAETQPPAGKAE
ncbi:MAG: TRAP transporter small permease [Thermoleophilia bacterium]|nr:TRAP transporter small permease [Thermoleophilia bacterium]